MKRALVFFLIVALAAGSAGCGKKRRRFAELVFPAGGAAGHGPGKSAVDMDLAEGIMLSTPYKLKISRDPFRPLSNGPSPIEESAVASIALSKVRVLGAVRNVKKGWVLLDVDGKTKAFSLGSQVGDYVIKKIEPKRVIFESGGQEFVLPLGVPEAKTKNE